MPANSRKGVIHYLAGKYPGKIGHLYNGQDADTPRFYLPYGLDNGIYGAFTRQEPWNEERYFQQLSEYWRYLEQKPLFCLVPDAVSDKDLTLQRWKQYSQRIRDLGFKTLAFAMQDGMSCSDVPDDAQVVFIGGSTAWKRGISERVCGEFDYCHIGRVNMFLDLVWAHRLGASSCDGSGFGREPANISRLTNYLDWTEDKFKLPEQMELL